MPNFRAALLGIEGTIVETSMLLSFTADTCID